MKKTFAFILICLLTSVFSFPCGAYHIGDVVGYALTTDIAATINGYDIPSYNVDGYTYIVVEDLKYYGFAVNYDDASRSLSVSRDLSQQYVSKVYQKPYVAPNFVGTREHNLVYTDIVTYLDGYYTPSFNINGQTIMRFDALGAYGEVSYDNSKREVSLSISGIASNPQPNQDRGKTRIWSRSEFSNKANGWWVDLDSCRSLTWDDGCVLDYIRFYSDEMEFGTTYSEFYTYEFKELTFIGNNTYNASFYMPGYWYADEYLNPEYVNATIIYDGGEEFKISFNGGSWYTYTFVGTAHDFDSLQRHPLVVDAASK